jgi:fructoselysine 6-kinase
MKVIGIGDNVVDDYIHLRTMFPGGNALNVSVYAAMLGCESAYVGVFGSDIAARHVQRALVDTGVDTSHCRTVEGENGHALLTIKDGERVFISSNEGGVSKSITMDFVFEDLDYLQTFSIIHTSAYSYLDDYLAQMQSLSPFISYDFSDDFEVEKALALCRYIDFGFFSCAHLSEESTLMLLEKAVDAGSTIAIATRGSECAILFDGHSWFKQAPLKITPIDTLGAGDAFITGFLISYARSNADARIEHASLIKKSLASAASFAAEICAVQGAFGHGLRY